MVDPPGITDHSLRYNSKVNSYHGHQKMIDPGGRLHESPFIREGNYLVYLLVTHFDILNIFCCIIRSLLKRNTTALPQL